MKELSIVGLMLLVMADGTTSVKAQERPGEFVVEPIPAGNIPVTKNKITTVVFPVRVQPVGKGARDVLAQKVRGTENIVIIKAIRSDFAPTNLTVTGVNGRLYSLDLHYEANPATCNFQVLDEDSGYSVVPERGSALVRFSGMSPDESTLSSDADTIAGEKPFLHYSAASEKARLTLKGFYLKDGMLWLTLRIRNRSFVDYPVDVVRFSIRDKKRSRRTAIQERFLEPVYASGDKLVPGNQSRVLLFAFHPFTVPRHKKLVLDVSDEDGGRVLTLTVGCGSILKAKPVD